MLRRSRIDEVPLGPAVYNFARRLKDSHVKISTIISRCISIDRNHDGIIHINDLEEILMDYLGADKVPRREIIQLGRILQSQRRNAPEGAIQFDRLRETIGKVMDDFEKENARSKSPKRKGEEEHPKSRDKGSKARSEDEEEHWFDPVDEKRKNRSEYEAGSIGHFLDEVACPAEVRNFQHLMYCMEKYERLTGLQCQNTRDGFIIPVGPDMKAKVSFVMGGHH